MNAHMRGLTGQHVTRRLWVGVMVGVGLHRHAERSQQQISMILRDNAQAYDQTSTRAKVHAAGRLCDSASSSLYLFL